MRIGPPIITVSCLSPLSALSEPKKLLLPRNDNMLYRCSFPSGEVLITYIWHMFDYLLNSSDYLLCKWTLHFSVSCIVPYCILWEGEVLNTLDLGWYICTISFHGVWRHFSPEMYKNCHSVASTLASSPCISHQHWWWASMWSADRVSQVCWICKVCSGRSLSVLNRSSVIHRDLQRSHLSDSFFFVIRWIQALDGNVWELVCSILLWSCDLTEVSFIHSPNSSRPSPSWKNLSPVNVDVIGRFWCCINPPSSLFLSRFWIRRLLREGCLSFRLYSLL